MSTGKLRRQVPKNLPNRRIKHEKTRQESNCVTGRLQRLSKGEQSARAQGQLDKIKRQIEEEPAPKPEVKLSSDNSAELRRRQLLFAKQAESQSEET